MLQRASYQTMLELPTEKNGVGNSILLLLLLRATVPALATRKEIGRDHVITKELRTHPG
jgi:hypothetical protein